MQPGIIIIVNLADDDSDLNGLGVQSSSALDIATRRTAGVCLDDANEIALTHELSHAVATPLYHDDVADAVDINAQLRTGTGTPKTLPLEVSSRDLLCSSSEFSLGTYLWQWRQHETNEDGRRWL